MVGETARKLHRIISNKLRAVDTRRFRVEKIYNIFIRNRYHFSRALATSGRTVRIVETKAES